MSNKLHKQTSSQYHKFHSTKQPNTADRQSNHHRLDNPNNQMPSTRKSTDPQPSRLTLTMHSILYNSLIMLYSHRILIAEPASQPSHVADDDPYRPQLPQKRPSDAMIALVMEEDGTLTLPRSHWGGSPPLGYGPRPRRCHQAYLASSQRKEDIEHLGKNPEDSDTSQGSDTSESEKEEDAVKKKGDGGPYKQGLSRAELKALDRELPWRKILEMPQSHIDKLIEAINKEAESWSSWQSVKPINDKDVDYILSHPTLKRRVLRSRGCYRDKAVGLGELRAKCRIVALGHLDPRSGQDQSEHGHARPAGGTSGLHDDLLWPQPKSLPHRQILGIMDRRRCNCIPARRSSRKDKTPFLLPPRDGLIALTNKWQHSTESEATSTD